MEQFSDLNVYTAVAIAALAVIALVLIVRSLVKGKSPEPISLPEPDETPPQKDTRRTRPVREDVAADDEPPAPKLGKPIVEKTPLPPMSGEESDAPHTKDAPATDVVAEFTAADERTANKVEPTTEPATEPAKRIAVQSTADVTAPQVEKEQGSSASAAVFTQPIVTPASADSTPHTSPSAVEPAVPVAFNIPSFGAQLKKPTPEVAPIEPLAPVQPTPTPSVAEAPPPREPVVEQPVRKPIVLPRPSPTREDREDREDKAPAAKPAFVVPTPPLDMLQQAPVEQPEPSPTPVSQPTSQRVSQPVSQPIPQRVSQPVSQPTPQRVSQPTPQRVSQPPTSQPVSQPTAQRASQPTPQSEATAKPKLDRDAILAKYGIRRSEDPKTASLESTDPRHREARRLARLFASEIVLYNADGIETGKKNKALYRHLKKDIDRCLQVFKTRVDADVRTKFDYLYDEIVKQVADGDESALGPEMPPPEAPRNPPN